MAKYKNTTFRTSAFRNRQRTTGFTIVELVVVIVVLGILASIIFYSVGSWRTRVAETEVKSDLNSVVAAMDSGRNLNNGYPTDPKFDGAGAIFQQGEGVLITYESGDAKSYCIEAQSKIKPSLSFFVKSPDKTPVQGTCSGGVGAVPVPTSPEYTVFTFDTRIDGCQTIILPVKNGTGTVHWGDGSEESVGIHPSHTYLNKGILTVSYQGSATSIGYDFGSTLLAAKACITGVKQWANNVGIVTMSHLGGASFTKVATPPVSVKDMSHMFYGSTSFNQDISGWNVQNVTNMNSMFNGAKAFNQPIQAWNTSNVTNMNSTFLHADSFNQPIGSWDTSKVTDMYGMFAYNDIFNQPIGSWNTANVTNMATMFDRAMVFNQPIGGWNTGKVTDMRWMFNGAQAGTPFNQPIGSWNTSKVTNMSIMFQGSKVFNQPIGGWDTSSVVSMQSMFSDATAFNQPIGGWNTIKVTDMGWMFMRAAVFNQPIGGWNTSAATKMNSMFNGAKAFNQPIQSWNTSNVTTMKGMFQSASIFNQDLSGWNVGAVTDHTNFDAYISAWTLPRPTW